MHAYLSRDGVDPAHFREVVRGELGQYPTLELRQCEVMSARRKDSNSFAVTLSDGREETSRTLLLATGVSDELPAIPNIRAFFGTSVFPCPYCDGWERRDEAVAVYGRAGRAFEMARAMTAWTRDILVCTDGDRTLSKGQLLALQRNGIPVKAVRISALSGAAGRLERIHFEDGCSVERRALFFDTPAWPQSDLAAQIGCAHTKSGAIRCGPYQACSVPGVFAAGNIVKDVQLSIVAAAEGARAAFGINRALTREEFANRSGDAPQTAVSS